MISDVLISHYNVQPEIVLRAGRVGGRGGGGGGGGVDR